MPKLTKFSVLKNKKVIVAQCQRKPLRSIRDKR
jgi:hypothetical protein